MPERQLVKYSEQKSQDYQLTDKTCDGKSFLKNQRTPASLAFKRQPSMKSPCGILPERCRGASYACGYRP